jgi:hypothetical protein
MSDATLAAEIILCAVGLGLPAATLDRTDTRAAFGLAHTFASEGRSARVVRLASLLWGRHERRARQSVASEERAFRAALARWQGMTA